MSDHPTNGGTTLRVPALRPVAASPVKGLGPLLADRRRRRCSPFSCLLHRRARGDRRRPALRHVRPHHRARAALQAAVRIEHGDQGRRSSASSRRSSASAPQAPACAAQYSQRELDGESLMLTGDLNVAVVEWVVQYRIVDPYKLPVPGAQRPRDLPRHERGGHARGGRRPHRQRGAHRRPPGDREPGRAEAAGALRPVRDRASRSSRWCCRTSTRPIRSSPPSTRSTRRSRSASELINEAQSRVQPGDPAGRGRGAADHRAGRGLRARPRQPGARATRPASPRSTTSTARRPRSPASASTSRRWSEVLPEGGAARSSSTRTLEGVLPLLNLGTAPAPAADARKEGGAMNGVSVLAAAGRDRSSRLGAPVYVVQRPSR